MTQVATHGPTSAHTSSFLARRPQRITSLLVSYANPCWTRSKIISPLLVTLRVMWADVIPKIFLNFKRLFGVDPGEEDGAPDKGDTSRQCVPPSYKTQGPLAGPIPSGWSFRLFGWPPTPCYCWLASDPPVGLSDYPVGLPVPTSH